MGREELQKEIIRQKNLMIKLATESRNPMQDSAVYAKSCEIDRLIVSYMRFEQREKREYLSDAI